MNILVVKRNGTKETFNAEKIHKVLEWSCDGVTGVSVSEIELASQLQLTNGITTAAIHDVMIRSASELITEDTPNYQWVAARLVSYKIRKEVFNSPEPDDLYTHWSKIAKLGFYDSTLIDFYSPKEWEALESYIDHDRDNLFAFAGIQTLRDKYLVKNKVTGQILESPQIAFMLLAMTVFKKYTKDKLKWVKDLYDSISTFEISLPTPIMAGVRTSVKQYSSCFLIETDDSLDSINATTSAIVKYVAQKAGVGIGGGKIRAYKSPIRGGDAYHTGLIPYYKLFDAAVNSVNQGGVRKGSATTNFVFWHLDIEDLLVLKNNKGTDETRIRTMDYCVGFNKVMYERLLEGGNITLFSPHDVPDLYDAFFVDVDKFRELYEKYEKSTKLRKKTIPANELFTLFMQERKDTGRIYFLNVDHANDHGSYIKELAPTRMTNLCVEISQPTRPLQQIDDAEAWIALCTLAANNLGKIKKPSDFEKPCTLIIRTLDALLDEQNYPVKAAETHTKLFRPLGVGFINLAYWLVKNNTGYSNPDLALIHEYAEAWSYYLIKASIELAEEVGPCEGFHMTKWSQGILPIDTYKSSIDDLVDPVYKMDWDALRNRPIRNATIMAQMPAETSAAVSNSTNGVEPPRSLVTIKTSKDGNLTQVVPGFQKYKNKYELLWNIPSPDGYLKIMAVLQKFIDQSISVNTSYNPEFYPDGEIPMSELLGHMLMSYKYGLKSGYYLNVYDGAGEVNTDEELCDGCII